MIGLWREHDNAKYSVRLPSGKLGVFSVMGNHEMYSNGIGFRDVIMPNMGTTQYKQTAPFFQIQNKYWRVIGLDSGYDSVTLELAKLNTELVNRELELHKRLMDWLVEECNISDPNDKRGIILMSHHQPISCWNQNYQCMADQLARVLPKDRKVLYLFGHEHRLVFFKEVRMQTRSGATFNFYGRLIGHGSFPCNVKDEPTQNREVCESSCCVILLT